MSTSYAVSCCKLCATQRFPLNALIIIIAIVCGSALAWSPRLSRSEGWQATVTPLASIMGSGFLISAPLLGVPTG